MNEIIEIIKEIEGKDCVFRPSSSFYKATRINRKRFGQIKRFEKSPTIEEFNAIAKYFDRKVTIHIS
jgi:hypothetical protein